MLKSRFEGHSSCRARLFQCYSDRKSCRSAWWDLKAPIHNDINRADRGRKTTKCCTEWKIGSKYGHEKCETCLEPIPMNENRWCGCCTSYAREPVQICCWRSFVCADDRQTFTGEEQKQTSGNGLAKLCCANDVAFHYWMMSGAKDRTKVTFIEQVAFLLSEWGPLEI